MFKTFDTKRFGETMKNLRLSHHLTQRDVFEMSGINIGTLQRLEKGTNLPKIDTLEILSKIYKIDVLELFLKFRSSKTLMDLYRDFDNLIIYNDYTSREEATYAFQEKLDEISADDLINQMELDQMKLLLEGMRLTGKKDYTLALNVLIEAISLTIPGFSIETFENHRYIHLETRILFMIATILGAMQRTDESNKILKMMLRIELEKESLDMNHVNLVCKIYYSITNNYHFANDHLNVIVYANEGIDYSRKFNSTYGNGLFYLRIGVAKHFLKDETYLEDLKKSICILNVYASKDYVDLVCDILLKMYNVDLSHMKLENI